MACLSDMIGPPSSDPADGSSASHRIPPQLPFHFPAVSSMPPGPPTPRLPPVTLEHSAGATFFMFAIPASLARPRTGTLPTTARAPEHPAPLRATVPSRRNHIVLQAPKHDPEQ